MEPTFASVTDKPCECGYLESQANDPDIPISFDRELNEYYFEFSSGLTEQKRKMIIYHCPFCGGAAPKSLRELQFATISNDEKYRLGEMTKNLKTIEEAIALLGEPDEDFPQGIVIERAEQEGQAPRVEGFRSLVYRNLSETAEVWITDLHKEQLQIALQGKYIGKS